MKNLRVFPRIEKRHIPQIEQIDMQRFGDSASSGFVKLAERSPHLYTILCLDDEVKGYGLVFPIDSFAKEAVKRGEIDEDELLRHAVPIENASADYIASIASSQNAGAILRSRLVGYTLGPVLRTQREAIAIAVSEDGDSIAREVGLTPVGANRTFTGINGYSPQLFVKPAFTWS